MKISGKILRKFIPYRWYKLIANGFIVVPKYYKDAIIFTSMVYIIKQK